MRKKGSGRVWGDGGEMQWEAIGGEKKVRVCGTGSQYSVKGYNMQWEGIRGDGVKIQREGRGREKKMRSRRGWGTGSKYSVKGLHAGGRGEGMR